MRVIGTDIQPRYVTSLLLEKHDADRGQVGGEEEKQEEEQQQEEQEEQEHEEEEEEQGEARRCQG